MYVLIAVKFFQNYVATSSLILYFMLSTAHGANMILKATPKNCAKISGYTENYINGAAISTGSPKSSLEWIGPHSRKYWKECVVQFKTPRGVFDCPVYVVLSSDNGITAFAQTFPGGPRCEKL